MTVFFAGTMAGICVVLNASTSRQTTVLAFGFLVLNPYTNLMILAQIDTDV